jgi:hypothetical protein
VRPSRPSLPRSPIRVSFLFHTAFVPVRRHIVTRQPRGDEDSPSIHVPTRIVVAIEVSNRRGRSGPGGSARAQRQEHSRENTNA